MATSSYLAPSPSLCLSKPLSHGGGAEAPTPRRRGNHGGARWGEVALASAMAGQTRSGARKRGGPGPRPRQGEAPLAPGAGAAGPPTRDVAGSTVVNSRLVKSGRTLASAIAMALIDLGGIRKLMRMLPYSLFRGQEGGHQSQLVRGT